MRWSTGAAGKLCLAGKAATAAEEEAATFGIIRDTFVDTQPMSFFTVRLAALAVFFSVVLSACGGGGSGGPAPAPTGVVAVPGNNQVTISWTDDTSVEYWIVYAAGTSVSTDNPSGIHAWARSVRSPFVITGLTNGTAYAFAINGRISGGKGGPSSASVTAIPRPAMSATATGWVTGSSTGSADLRGVTYGLNASNVGAFLAVGDATITSPVSTDSTSTWASITPPSSFVANDVTYATNVARYVTVGNSGKVFYSTDLTTPTWTAASATSPATTQHLNAVFSNGSGMVAVGNAGTIITSVDGISWAQATTVPVGTDLYGVTYGGGYWIAVGAAGTLLTSTNGATWVAVPNSTPRDLRGVAVQYDATGTYKFVAVGQAGTVLTSLIANVNANGAWQANTIAGDDLYAVNASYNQFLTVGANGAAYTSPDSATWVAAPFATGASTILRAIYGSSTAYYVVGDGGKVFVAK